MHQVISARDVFQSPPGYLWGSTDFSSQEFRVAGAMSADENIIKIYLLEDEYNRGIRPLPIDPNGNVYSDPSKDVHIIAACALSKDVQDLRLNQPWLCNQDINSMVKEWRNKAKVLNYSSIYLVSTQSLSEQLACTLEQAEIFIRDYFSYPNGFYQLYAWLQANSMIGEKTRWVRTALGGMIFCNDSNAKGLGDIGTVGRKAVNSRIQGTGAEQCKLAAIYCDKEMDRLNYKYRNLLGGREGHIIAIVHDEINCLIPGNCRVLIGEDKKDKEKKYYYTDKSCFDENNPEHAMALEYADAMKSSMMRGMQETFDEIGTVIPPGADVKIAKWWWH